MATVPVTDTKKDDKLSQSNKPSTNKKKNKKKKKKKNNILYQQDACKYYEGLIKNKRFNKGIDLSTGCMIFKTAWELPENNGLILPSRIIRHFKQVLPKKQKKKKNNKKKTTKTTDKDNNTSNVSPTPHDTFKFKSRSVMGLNLPSNFAKMDNYNYNYNYNYNINNVINNDITGNNEERRRRSMFPTTNSKKDLSVDSPTSDEPEPEPASAHSANNLHNVDDDEQKDIIEHLKNIKNNDIKARDDININVKIDDNNNNKKDGSTPNLTASTTSQTPDVYIDHADIHQEDLKPDVEEQTPFIPRAQTDVRHIHPDTINFKVVDASSKSDKKLNGYSDKGDIKESVSPKKSDKDDLKKSGSLKKSDNDGTKKSVSPKKSDKDNMNDNDPKPPSSPKKKNKKKKKKKQQILYCEDATRLFKKINDGKRFKNGIKLSKACKIFGVAWELPEENGRILPSKIVRHFKNAFPSKKNLKKNKKGDTIKPAMIKSQTVRHNMNINDNSVSKHHINRTIQINANNKVFFNKLLNDKPPYMGAKKSIISDLENLLSSDPNRSKQTDNGNNKKKGRRAASLTKINLDDIHDDDDHDQIVENDIDQLIKQKQKEKKEKQKQMDDNKTKDDHLRDAIDAAF